MQPLPFVSLSDADINISDISCEERHWKSKWENEYPSGRDQNVLSFTFDGNKRLFLPGSDTPMFDVKGPSAFFIAHHNPYISKSSVEDEGEEGRTICIKFRLTDKRGELLPISDKYLCWDSLDVEMFSHLFEKVMSAYLETETNNLALKSALYRLLSELVISLRTEYRSYHGFDDLFPALEFVDKNLSKNISVDELAKMCFMSNSYFCKRFKEYSGGDCFTEYRNKMRIKKATELLDSSSCTINMIARTLGFYDTSHFYRVYKKYTGKTPKVHKKT